MHYPQSPLHCGKTSSFPLGIRCFPELCLNINIYTIKMALPSRSRSHQDEPDTDEDDAEAASFYAEDANRDHKEHTLNRHISTTPQTNTPPPFSYNPAASGAFLPEEIPDSQEDTDSEDLLSPTHKSSWSFESDRTVLIPGGTKITKKRQPKYVSLFILTGRRVFQLVFSLLVFLATGVFKACLSTPPFLAGAPDRATSQS